jgi:general secretion pathway protein K
MSMLMPPSTATSGFTLPQRPRNRGSVLILVFSLIAVLSYIVVATFRVVDHDVKFSISRKKGFTCRQLAESGLNVAMNPAVQRWDRALLQMSPSGDDYMRWDVKIAGEGGKINLNALARLGRDTDGRVFVDQLFERLGIADEAQRRRLIACLVDWTDEDDGKMENGMERDDYRELGNYVHPLNRPFYSLEEPPLVPGFDAITAAHSDWKEIFTIYSQGKIDLNEASAKVISLTTGADLQAAQEAVEKRWGEDNIEDTEDDANAKFNSVEEAFALAGVGNSADAGRFSQYFTLNDTTTLIKSSGIVGDFKKTIVVVVRSRQGQPQILMREERSSFE